MGTSKNATNFSTPIIQLYTMAKSQSLVYLNLFQSQRMLLIKRFANSKLADLTTEFLQDFIITDLFVGLLKDTDALDERNELLQSS